MNSYKSYNLKKLMSCTLSLFLLTSCTNNKEESEKTKATRNQKTVKLESGLAYEILKKGKADSASPQKGQLVTVHYTGWLEENGKQGKKFDSSVDRGKMFSFNIGTGQVISGWDEGVMTMKIGEKRRLLIPANLAYGERGAGGVIPPNATLIFDVELFEVKG